MFYQNMVYNFRDRIMEVPIYNLSKLFPYSNLLIVLRMTTFTNGFTQNIRLRK
jgi:hypothetical protein